MKMNGVYNYCVQIVNSVSLQSTTNRYQEIPIYLSIGIDNRYQSITTRIFAIDWSSIININRSIDIDWNRLISIVIDYRFHRLDTPGVIAMLLYLNFNCLAENVTTTNATHTRLQETVDR